MSEQIVVRDNQDKGQYELETEAGLALAAYRMQGDTGSEGTARSVIVFTHTEVPEELEGQGIGSALARHVLDDARARGLRVRPLCPFIAGYIKRHQEYQDLVVG